MSGTFKDITGQRFGKLVVLCRGPSTKGQKAQWICKCDCGNENVVATNTLRSGHTSSCGCGVGSLFKRSHGMRETPTYNIWCHMKRRCQTPTDPDFHHYGERGISVCARWQTFENFFADMGEAPKGFSIERRDVNGNYEPSNCEWIKATEQPRNTRRSRYANVHGERMIFSDVARKLGVSTGLVTMWAQGKRPPPSGITFEGAVSL